MSTEASAQESRIRQATAGQVLDKALSREAVARRLIWHGILLFLLGLLTGALVGALKNPRMGISAHLEGVMNGTFLAVLGLAWQYLRLSSGLEAAAYWLALYGTYVNWAATLLAAVFGTSVMTPIIGQGYTAERWQELVVNFGLITLSLAMIAVCCVLLWGFRAKASQDE